MKKNITSSGKVYRLSFEKKSRDQQNSAYTANLSKILKLESISRTNSTSPLYTPLQLLSITTKPRQRKCDQLSIGLINEPSLFVIRSTQRTVFTPKEQFICIVNSLIYLCKFCFSCVWQFTHFNEYLLSQNPQRVNSMSKMKSFCSFNLKYINHYSSDQYTGDFV